MDGVRTRGHPGALAAIARMIRGPAPHAVLLVGPAGIGKTTLALDLAAGLLCTAADTAARPCGACRACRLVASGSHPDLHRLGPEGPGRQVAIGGTGSKARGVRDLIAELALMPVEGGARVAIVESASRMNEDAQAAMLKTLEEPPPGVTIALCADAEEAMLPTIRSRCVTVRLGPVAVRDVERILTEHGAADPGLAARLARIAGGRPGVALAWAADPEALRARDELVRSLLDLVGARPSVRLPAVRAALGRAGTLVTTDGAPAPSRGPRPPGRSARGTGDGQAAVEPVGVGGPADETADEGETEATGPVRASATERRRAAEALVAVWTDLARDLALCQRGLPNEVREIGLLDETTAVATRLGPSDLTAFLDRLGRAGVLLVGNVSPELVIDDLALAWPRPRTVAA
jgi:DNA polymerase III subunit delta'